MSRFEDSPGLFGCGAGISTLANIECEMCGRKWKDRERANGEPTSIDNESILHTMFAGLEICECCFERVEKAVLARIDDILPWYGRILKSRNEMVIRGLKTLDAVRSSKGSERPSRRGARKT